MAASSDSEMQSTTKSASNQPLHDHEAATLADLSIAFRGRSRRPFPRSPFAGPCALARLFVAKVPRPRPGIATRLGLFLDPEVKRVWAFAQ